MKKPNQHLTEEVFDAAFEASATRLPGTRPDLAAEIATLSEQFAPLLEALPEVEPPEGLFDAIAAEIDGLPTAPTQSVRAHEGDWKQRDDKVWMKVLARDDTSGRLTYLLRCLPGAVIRPHLHKRAEHILVLEGEVWMNGKLHSAGDAQISLPSSEHAEVTMPAGCLVLVSA